MTSRHTNPAIYAGLAGAAAWATPTCANALTVLGHDVSLSQPGVSFALGCVVGAAVACGTSAVVTHAMESRRERERAEQAIAEHAAHARQARAAQAQARQAESRAYQAARAANEKIAYAEAMEAKQAAAEAAARQARVACNRAAQAKVSPQTTAQFVAAAKQASAARTGAPSATDAWAQTGNVRVQPVPVAGASRPASPQSTSEFIAAGQCTSAASQRPAGAAAQARGQQAQANGAQPQAPRYTVPSHYGSPSTGDPNNSGAWAAWQAGANANADYLDVAEAYVNRITLADRMAKRAKGVAGVLSERLGASKMEGLPVIARADGSVGDVGENWWNDAVGNEVRPVGEAMSGLRGVNEAMAENSAVLFTTQTYQQAQAARSAQQARAAQQPAAAARPAGQGAASARQQAPYAQQASAAPRPNATQQQTSPHAAQQGATAQHPAAGARPVTSAFVSQSQGQSQANAQAQPDRYGYRPSAPQTASRAAQQGVAGQPVRPGQPAQPRASVSGPIGTRVPQVAPAAPRPAQPAAAPRDPRTASAAQPRTPASVPTGVQQASRPAQPSQPAPAVAAPRPAAPVAAQQTPAQAHEPEQGIAARTDRETIAKRLGDPKVAFPDKKATRWSDQQQDLWQVALAALDERTNEEIALRAAAEPVPVTFTPGYDELDEPDHIEPVTQFMAFKPQAGKPDVVDAESYVDMLVDQELSKSESPAVRKLARHGIRDFFKVVDGGTHGFKPTKPTQPGHLALQQA